MYVLRRYLPGSFEGDAEKVVEETPGQDGRSSADLKNDRMKCGSNHECNC